MLFTQPKRIRNKLSGDLFEYKYGGTVHASGAVFFPKEPMLYLFPSIGSGGPPIYEYWDGKEWHRDDIWQRSDKYEFINY